MLFYTHLEDMIKEICESICIQKPNQLNMKHICERLGIKLFFWDEDSQALKLRNTYYILINNSLSSQEQWQDFGHEMAHILLHAGRQTMLPEYWVNYQEMKANYLMYQICIPTFMLDLYTCEITPHLIVQDFNVMYDFAAKRLEIYKQKLLLRNTFVSCT